MRKKAIVTVLAGVAMWWVGLGSAYAGENLDINGAFIGEKSPQGWSSNKPGYWDNEGQVTLTHISDIERNAVRLTSVSRAMHLYTSARPFAVGGGDKVVVRGLMRGRGAGMLGIYYYPGGGWLKKEFQVSEDWSEFAAELVLPEGAATIRAVIGIPPRASTEFLDLTAALGEGNPAPSAAAQTDLHYPLYPLTKPPVMDGGWDDEAWTDIPDAA